MRGVAPQPVMIGNDVRYWPRIDVVTIRLFGHHLEAVTIVAGRGYDTGIVATTREQICHVGLGLKIDLVC